ncbi:MAG: peptidylprolyl isomerase [Eubacteriales bacterium]|nr:peptidylprolyl isomerase [Eubacteriales bacterium]MDD4474765.1 peptidylprolyl isomerase [Eubacteriales bacterium]
MKLFKRIIALALVAVSLFVVTSCSKSSVTLMEYDGASLSSGMFSYGLSLNKTQVLYNFGIGADNATIWGYDAGNGKTIGQAVYDNYVENCKLNLVADAMLKELGAKESDETVSYLNSIYDANVSVQGSVAKLDVYLADFGLNAAELKEYYRLSTKFYDLIDYYYGDEGAEKLTEKQYYDDLTSEYNLVQHILYKNSKSILEESTNTSKTVSMTEEEVAALKEEIEAKVKQITDGEKTYEDFISENQDGNLEYLVTDNGSFVPEFEKAAKEMTDGEIRIVESQFGFHVMRKVAITEEKYAEMKDEQSYNQETVLSQRAYLEQDMAYKKLEEKLKDVTVTENELAKFDIVTAPVIEM